MIKGQQYKLRNGLIVRYIGDNTVKVVAVPIGYGYKDNYKFIVGEDIILVGLKKKYLSGGCHGKDYDVVGENNEVKQEPKLEKKEECMEKTVRELTETIGRNVGMILGQPVHCIGIGVGRSDSFNNIMNEVSKVLDNIFEKENEKENRKDDTFSHCTWFNEDEDRFFIKITNDRTDEDEVSSGSTLSLAVAQNTWADKLPDWYNDDVPYGNNILHLINRDNDEDIAISDNGKIVTICNDI